MEMLDRKISKIVVTGATSTVGVATINEAIKNNIEVLAICSKNSTKLSRLPDDEKIEILECDISNYSSISREDFNKEFDAFFHFAWLSSINSMERNNLYPQANNIIFALDSVELAYRLGCKVYIGAGSQAEYGKCDKILDEDSTTNPESAYGMAKLCAGQMTRMACNNKKIEHIWPRIFSVYGPCCADYTVIQYTIKSLLAGERPSLSGGEQVWDFLFTEDIGRALLALARRGKNNEVYCVASGQSRLLKEFIYDIRDCINPNAELGLGDISYNSNTVMHLEADIRKLTKDVGFKPEISFIEGINKTIEWNRNRLNNSR